MPGNAIRAMMSSYRIFSDLTVYIMKKTDKRSPKSMHLEKDEEKQQNGSYLYRLNRELSGQAELAPYLMTMSAADDADFEETGQEHDNNYE